MSSEEVTTMTEETKTSETEDMGLVPREVLISTSQDFIKKQQESARDVIKLMCAKATQERLEKAKTEGTPTSVNSPIIVTKIPEKTFNDAGGRIFIEKWLQGEGGYQLDDVRRMVTDSSSHPTAFYKIMFH